MQLLPEGFEPIDKDTPRTKIIENYKNTGKTAVIYDAHDIMPNDFSTSTPYINSRIRILPYAKHGSTFFPHILSMIRMM